MGTILWIPTWAQGPDFAIQRSYTDLVVVLWQTGSFVQVTNPIILLEIPFGGYRFYVKFKDQFWNWSSSAWRLIDIFEDFYAISPSGDIVNAGLVWIAWGPCSPFTHNGLVLQFFGLLDEKSYFMGLPAAPPDYWQTNDSPIPPLPFIYDS